MTTGKIKWFNKVKGYGFIGSEECTSDIFLHFTSILEPCRTLDEGDEVIFDIVPGEKGIRAANVKRKE